MSMEYHHIDQYLRYKNVLELAVTSSLSKNKK